MSWWIAETERTLTEDVAAPPDEVRDPEAEDAAMRFLMERLGIDREPR